MYRYLIVCIIALTAAMLPAQTTPRSGNTPSANSGRTSIAPSDARPSRNNPSPSRDSKTQKTSERSSGATTTRTDAAERSTSNDAILTAKGSYRPTTGSGTTTTRSSSTRPAYSNPLTSRTLPSATSPQRKKAAAKPVERVTVNWMTLEEAMEKSKTEKRKIFVDVYTSWCGWCKHMDSTTFVSGAVAKYLNDHYYPVKFNAEQQNDIVFKDKTYRFKKTGNRGHHELAAEWLNNRLTFPTTVFLDENMNLIQSLGGYQDANKMEAIINYFGTDSHKKVPWESYEKKFVPQQ